jgi:hypothetical protein
MSNLQDIARTRQSLARGVQWLLAQQGDDGGWHSTTYGQLKEGAGVTALVLYALRQSVADPGPKVAEAMRRGFEFLSKGLAKRGTIASPNGTLDFPTYAAALWLEADRGARVTGPFSSVRRDVVDYLLAAQVTAGRGFEAKSPSYGGWDFLGRDDAQGVTTGTNTSITCHALEALMGQVNWWREGHRGAQLSVLRRIDESVNLGKAYTLRCQQPDGGFAFTCEPGSLNNKALYADEKLTQPRSYGTATCDGIRTLVACGGKPTDEPIAKALTWLEKRPALEVVPGFEGLPPEAGWQRGLRFYYYAALARVLPLFAAPVYTTRREALIKHVLDLQNADGSWLNESDRMRENDPLIATSFALSCLARLV